MPELRTRESRRRAVRHLLSADTTDHFDVRIQARIVLADCLVRAGETDEAAGLGEAAAVIAEEKGDVAGVAWIRLRIARLGA